MKCVTGYDKDTYVYFSVPNDEGWTATIDGEKTEIINSGGMMLIKVPAGNHNVEFKYFTPWLKIGTIIAVLCWIIFAGIMIFKKGVMKNDRCL